MSTVLPEVAYKAIIEQGLRALTQNLGDIDELFADFPPTVRTYIKTYFQQHPNIPVRFNWPRPDVTFPIIAIVLGSESEDPAHDFVGDQMQSEYTGRDGDGVPTMIDNRVGYAQNVSHNILIVTNSEEATLYLYNVVKRLLFAAKMLLEERRITVDTVSGSDMQFEEGYFPEFAFTRSLTITAQVYFSMVDASEWVLRRLDIVSPAEGM